MVDIGVAGWISDNWVFKSSQMGHDIDNKLLNVPPADEENFSYVLAGPLGIRKKALLEELWREQ